MMMEMFKKKEYGEMLKTTLRVTNSALSNLKNVYIILPLAFCPPSKKEID